VPRVRVSRYQVLDAQGGHRDILRPAKCCEGRQEVQLALLRVDPRYHPRWQLIAQHVRHGRGGQLLRQVRQFAIAKALRAALCQATRLISEALILVSRHAHRFA